MENYDVARKLEEAALLVEEQDGNPFRARAYRRAADVVLRLERPISEVVLLFADSTEAELARSLKFGPPPSQGTPDPGDAIGLAEALLHRPHRCEVLARADHAELLVLVAGLEGPEGESHGHAAAAGPGEHGLVTARAVRLGREVGLDGGQ